jgi:hypothetical protein
LNRTRTRASIGAASLAAVVFAAGCQPTTPTFTTKAVVAPPVGTAPTPTVTNVGFTGARVTATLSWARAMTAQDVSQSSPVVVDNGGSPFVVAGDLGGNLRAFDLRTGTPRGGFGNTGYEVKAPLSSDGANVYVPVAQDGKDRTPQVKKFNANGGLVWQTNAGIRTPAPGVGFLLGGVSLASTSTGWRGFVPSSGHWFYGLDAANGATKWAFRNAESTMSTIALADVYGIGTPQVIVSNDRGAEFSNSLVGGHLRILTANGSQICTDVQPVRGRAYANSGYNNSSPIVAQISGNPLIVFGSTGPVQYGNGGNQMVAYNNDCTLRWASAPMAAQAEPSPSFADVLGTGVPQVVAMVGAGSAGARYPRVYVFDAATGKTLWDTGTSLSRYGGALAYPQSMQIVTADVDNDGYQDLFVPGTQLVVISGKTRQVLAELPIAGAIQNTPVLSSEPGGGVRVTIAGYSGNNGSGGRGSMVRSFVIDGAKLGDRGWRSFGNGPRLTGLSGTLKGKPYDQLLENQQLASGQVLTSRSGRYKLTMQTDGNLVVTNSSAQVLWATHTSGSGAVASLNAAGTLEVRRNGKVLWSSGKTSDGISRLTMQNDGRIVVTSAIVANITERTAATARIWGS